ATRTTGAIDHVALDVQDIDTLFTKVTALGHKALEGHICSLPFWEKGVKFFTIKGPDGEKIEFCERLR
ncbi:MAG: VOC family protein, partial [Muribaculum sp.]|nr:VOC family protein [Muribaculum sp.]